MSTAYIALGANLSNPKESFLEALSRLENQGVAIKRVSGLWQSPSWPPGKGHPDYLNAVAEVACNYKPMELLQILQSIELELGRQRTVRNAPRTLDLDILDFSGNIVDSEALTLPHPRMLTRGFVLFPLSQIAPNWQDPKTAKSIQEFIAKLPLDDVAPMQYVGQFYFDNSNTGQ